MRREESRLRDGGCVKVVVVGSGLAGVTVAEGLAKSGRHRVLLVTAEAHGYYSRPRLSHGLALSDAASAKIVLKPFDALRGIQVLAGAEARMIDRETQRLVLESGEALTMRCCSSPPARRRASHRRSTSSPSSMP